jgi:hypothetical protein
MEGDSVKQPLHVNIPSLASGELNQFAFLFDNRVPMGRLNQNSLTQIA